MSRVFTVHYISLSYLASNGISLTSVAQGFPPAKHLNPSRRSKADEQPDHLQGSELPTPLITNPAVEYAAELEP